MSTIFNEAEKSAIGKKVMEVYNASNFFGSKSKFAKSVGLVVSDMTNIEHEKWKANKSLIGERKWITLSRIVGYSSSQRVAWKSADTYVKKFVFKQLSICKNESLTAMLVDDAGIGKTYSAKLYGQENKGVFYVDCSVANRKTELIRALGKAVGVGEEGKLSDLLCDSIQALSLMNKPLLILDEAGDMDNKSILIVKQIYNALEGMCGIYLIGADGLRSKMMGGLQNKRLGYAEVFSRFGRRFSSCLPLSLDEKKDTLKNMAEDIIKANGIAAQATIKAITSKLFVEGLHDMRRIKREVVKQLMVSG